LCVYGIRAVLKKIFGHGTNGVTPTPLALAGAPLPAQLITQKI